LRSVQLEYVGEATTDHRGMVTPRGKPVRFGWSRFEPNIEWSVRWYGWDAARVADPKAAMPKPGQVLSRTELASPLATHTTRRLDFVTGGSPFAGVPNDHFITLADGQLTVEAGEYELSVVADDGIRIYLDDELIIDEWHWQGPTRYAKNVKLSGRHRVRLEHYEIDGYTALKVELAPKR
jgi:hypothetical protein